MAEPAQSLGWTTGTARSMAAPQECQRVGILASGDTDPDFQLTGFEWAVRISGVTGSVSSPRTRRRKSGAVFSFRDDWRALGGLIARLLGAPSNRLSDARIPASEVADHLNVEEIRLLRAMLRMDGASERLDAEVIERRVHEVLGRLRAQIANRSPQLHLVVGLGPNSQLTQRLREVSGYIESGAMEEQVAFVRDDLADNPRLLALEVRVERTTDDYPGHTADL